MNPKQITARQIQEFLFFAAELIHGRPVQRHHPAWVPVVYPEVPRDARIYRVDVTSHDDTAIIENLIDTIDN